MCVHILYARGTTFLDVERALFHRKISFSHAETETDTTTRIAFCVVFHRPCAELELIDVNIKQIQSQNDYFVLKPFPKLVQWLECDNCVFAFNSADGSRCVLIALSVCVCA